MPVRQLSRTSSTRSFRLWPEKPNNPEKALDRERFDVENCRWYRECHGISRQTSQKHPVSSTISTHINHDNPGTPSNVDMTKIATSPASDVVRIMHHNPAVLRIRTVGSARNKGTSKKYARRKREVPNHETMTEI